MDKAEPILQQFATLGRRGMATCCIFHRRRGVFKLVSEPKTVYSVILGAIPPTNPQQGGADAAILHEVATLALTESGDFLQIGVTWAHLGALGGSRGLWESPGRSLTYAGFCFAT